MDLDIVFLGTGGSAPSPSRGVSATLIRRGGERILLDCGEGTQRQLLRSSVGLVDVDMIAFTHFHGDHMLGLPGLLKTYGLRNRDRGLELYGPEGLRTLLRVLDPLIGRLPFPLHVRELEPGDQVPGDGYVLEVSGVAHRATALAWALVEDVRPGRFDLERARALGVPEGPLFGTLQRGEPVRLEDGRVIEPGVVLGEARAGRRIVFSGDTRPCDSLRAAATDADVLVHEATFVGEERERARETGHSTAAEAAELAAEVGVDLLALTHLGARAPVRLVKAEARELHPNTVVPRDFDTIEVPLPERGSPQLCKAGAARDGEREPELEAAPDQV